jgi:hypothetical protein
LSLLPRRSGTRLELALVALLLLLAAFFRLYRLDSVPMGLTPDLAFNGLDARDVLAGHLPVFFPRNNGREALFIYFQALVLAGAGFKVLAFSYAGAFMGMLGVATTYRLWKALFGWRIALLGAFFLAVTFWDVDQSRLGFRVNALLPFFNATMYLLWRLLYRGRTKYAIFGGLAMGLCLYTYISSRLLPFVALAGCLCAWTLARKRMPQLAVMAAVALAVFLPEGIYFLRHPQEFTLRATEVSFAVQHTAAQGVGETPASALRATLGMFFVRGDVNPAYNLIGRPVFEPWEAVLFLAGLALALWKARESPSARWLLCWLVIMLVPSALSIESPNSMRALGAAPVILLLPALAVDAIGRLLRRLPLAYPALGLLVAVPAGVHDYDLYFNRWANDWDAYGATDASRLHMAQFVANRPETRIYFADSDITGHVVRMFVPTTNWDGWIPESSAAVPLPSRLEGDTLYIGVSSSGGSGSAINDLIPSWLPGVVAYPHPNNPLGKPDFYAFTWPKDGAAKLLASLTPSGQELGKDFAIVGYSIVRDAGSALTLDVVWRPLTPGGPYDMYVHLLDSAGKQLGQSDRLAYPVRDFSHAHEGLGPVLRGYFDEGTETDDWLLTQHSINAPPASYTAEIGLAVRDPANPAKVTAGVGSIRVPVSVSP